MLRLEDKIREIGHSDYNIEMRVLSDSGTPNLTMHFKPKFLNFTTMLQHQQLYVAID